MLRRPRALLLDLDGTLLDTPVGRDAARAATAAHVERESGIEAERWVAAELAAATEVWGRVGDEWVHGRVPSASVSAEIWAVALERVGAPPSLRTALGEIWPSASLAGARLFPDGERLVASARALGIACAVITNGAADTQVGALRATGILDSMDYVAVSAEHGVAKPDPALFRVALDRLGVAPEDAWHVGDRLADDVAGALAAGITAVWLDRSGAGPAVDPRPDATVSDLDGVAVLLAATGEV